MKNIFGIILLVILFNPDRAFSKTLVISDSTQRYDAVMYTASYDEGDTMLPAETILSGTYDSRFELNKKRQIDFGITDLRKWYRLEIRNETDANYLLEIDKGYIDYLEFYGKNDSNQYTRITTGDLLSISTRPLRTHSFLFPINLKKGETTVFYFNIRVVDPLQFSVNIATIETFLEWDQVRVLINGICFGITIVMILFNLIIYFSIRDRSYLYYILYNTCVLVVFAYLSGYGNLIWGQHYPGFNSLAGGMICVTGMFMLAFGNQFLHTKEILPWSYKLINAHIIAYGGIILLNCFGLHAPVAILIQIVSLTAAFSSMVIGVMIARKGYSPAWVFLLGWGIFLTSIVIYILVDLGFIPYSNTAVNPMQIGSAAESVLFALALANKMNFYKKEKDDAQLEAFTALEKNKELIQEQNVILEAKVVERTAELRNSNSHLALTLDNLKKTQDQLIHSEKMASLGQMAAGIAHEIDNPINFIRNFSESSIQLLEELQSGIPQSEKDLLMTDLTQNLSRIAEHGNRADRIVKSMILHSRNRGTELTSTNIVKLGRECMLVAYQGIKAQTPDFECELNVSEQTGIPEIPVIAQEISRVFLNVFHNAFYYMRMKSESCAKKNETYTPELILDFGMNANEIVIRIIDNGTGIPENIRDKIFLPFFTTKPTGEGTGLGLSISYEIMVKVHGGKINVISPDHEGAEFVLILPLTSA